jgi:hypothetical protein
MGRRRIRALKQDWWGRRLGRWRVDRQGARACSCRRARATPGAGVCAHLGHGCIRANRARAYAGARARAELGAGVCDYLGRGRIPAHAPWRRRWRITGQATRRPSRRPVRGRVPEGRVTFWASRAVHGALGRHGSPVGGTVQVAPEVVHRSASVANRQLSPDSASVLRSLTRRESCKSHLFVFKECFLSLSVCFY